MFTLVFVWVVKESTGGLTYFLAALSTFGADWHTFWVLISLWVGFYCCEKGSAWPDFHQFESFDKICILFHKLCRNSLLFVILWRNSHFLNDHFTKFAVGFYCLLWVVFGSNGFFCLLWVGLIFIRVRFGSSWQLHLVVVWVDSLGLGCSLGLSF